MKPTCIAFGVGFTTSILVFANGLVVLIILVGESIADGLIVPIILVDGLVVSGLVVPFIPFSGLATSIIFTRTLFYGTIASTTKISFISVVMFSTSIGISLGPTISIQQAWNLSN